MPERQMFSRAFFVRHGRLGARKLTKALRQAGGRARAKALSPSRRSEIAAMGGAAARKKRINGGK